MLAIIGTVVTMNATLKNNGLSASCPAKIAGN
jgi:hypothetical protein